GGGRQGTLDAGVSTPRFAARYGDLNAVAATPESVPALAPAARAARTAPPPAPDRDWTASERDVFNRHVVNLRGGVLSTDGSFSSSRDQVQQIFRTHIPEYVRRQKSLNEPARVLFFAHGGLNDEREGLLPV